MRRKLLAITAVLLVAVVGLCILLAHITGGSGADWLAACGTVAAVAVALWIALEDRWRQPRLSVVCGAEKPWWKESAQGGPGTHALRVQICNESPTPAARVRVRCELFERGFRDATSGELSFGHPDLVTGLHLPWYEGGVTSTESYVDLAPGASRYALVCKLDATQVILPDPGPRNQRADAYRLVLTVVSDRSVPLRTGLLLVHRDPDDLFDVSVDFVPPQADSDPLYDPSRTRRVRVSQ